MKKWLSFIICLFLLSGCTAAPDNADSSYRSEVTASLTESFASSESTETSETSSEQSDVSSEESSKASSVSQSSRKASSVSSVQSAATSYVAASSAPVLPKPKTLEERVNAMTAEQLVGQMFLARHPATDSAAVNDIKKYRLGGYILFKRDFENKTPADIRKRTASYNSASEIPMFFAVDEEGGRVTRVSSIKAFRSEPFPSPRSVFNNGGMAAIRKIEQEKSALLHSIGLNMNMAPVCDITTDPSYFMYDRSLGQTPEITGEYVKNAVTIAAGNKVAAVLKHFPGYGNNVDTHTDIAEDNRALSELEAVDLVPFKAGITAGCGAVMISHITVKCIDSKYPATLSPAVHNYLRNTMGFDGVIVTDDLSMQAITKAYGLGESAVLAVIAGNDLLCSTDYKVQYEAVLSAVKSGRIPIDTVRKSVLRLMRLKSRLGII